MARKLRVQYPGAIYHGMNRGDRRESIFNDDQDRRLFLDTLTEACAKTDWQIHAWCLISNHFHLVAETPSGNLVDGMQLHRKSDPQKVRIAARLRRETTMTLEWIASRLCMGAPTHVASLLQRQGQEAQNSEKTLFRIDRPTGDHDKRIRFAEPLSQRFLRVLRV